MKFSSPYTINWRWQFFTILVLHVCPERSNPVEMCHIQKLSNPDFNVLRSLLLITGHRAKLIHPSSSSGRRNASRFEWISSSNAYLLVFVHPVCRYETNIKRARYRKHKEKKVFIKKRWAKRTTTTNQREPKFTYNISARDPAKVMKRDQSRSPQAFVHERFPGLWRLF